VKFSTLLVAATLVAAPATAFADGAKTGTHGGPRTDAGPYHAELVLQGNDVVLYVTDGSDKPVDVTGAKAEATILANKQTQKVALEPAGANALKGKANLGEPHDSVKVVTALTMPGQKPVQARFEVGHAGH
jgi:nitrogen fixation protein FixH